MRSEAAAGDLATRLKRLDSCAVSDALDKLKLTGVVIGLPQLSSLAPDRGPRADRETAAWGRCLPELFAHNGTTAIMSAQPGRHYCGRAA